MGFSFRKGGEQEEITPYALGSEEAEATGVEALNILKHFEHQHKLDPNLPIEELNELDAILRSGDAEKGIEIEAALMEDNSPYPEVRAAVRNYDVELPANTIRAWIIGLVLCSVGSAINMLFSLRNPSVIITTYVIQLIAYPIGLGWDLIFPDREFRVAGLKFNFKPGKFNFKEHVVIVCMSNAAYGGGALYATDVLLAQQIFYGQHFGWAFQLLFGITTLCTGYGLAGLARRFLVWPAAMIWPADLVNASLFYTLHDHTNTTDPGKTNGWSIGRYKYFLMVLISAFVWYWFPGWIFMGFSYFNFVCWAAPNNIIVNKIFGGLRGYGLIPTTLDWTVASGYAGSPLIPPWHAVANTVAGVIVFFVIISMGLHFSGTWYSDYFVVQSPNAFDNTGAVYNVSRILDENLQFDAEKYHAYSPLYLSTQFALCYGLAFAAVAAIIVHVVLYHGPEIVRQFKLARNQDDDVHMRLMKKYRDAEDWWYLALFVVMVGLSFVVCCAWPTGFPAWAYVVCMILPLIWTIPIGIIQAITNIQLGLNVLTEYVIGYLLPGHPVAMMMFKNYGYLCTSQALFFAQDLKLGHYMKVPPCTMFWSQLIASIWSAIVQIAVMNWALGNIPDVCSDDQPNGYTCPGSQVFFTASIIWGAIGPARIFSGEALYSDLQWFWLVGAVAPVIAWFFARRYPKSIWRYVNMPLFFGGSGWLPPATTYNYLCWGTVGMLFNFFIKRRFNGWWLQYNYITSAALDCGLVTSTIVIFFTLYLTEAYPPQWFGNVGAFETMDQQGTAIKSYVAEGEIFGPTSWP
ncbi:OPT family small oligopeptide transporter [Pseudomassariella vexata]|uniref:OPT family small oligopeptide transporter n=1 Tax=Pseudomassariella vexata TaxID=1141098 RepID=A0A1Y2D7M9_9PEZI|nr:OPT family small oligopeptide transporter [Pseudomassariella vexata]ORY55280.1 OPT family small oligopeptide transporter [Pseudomassariella vexata]